MSKLKIFFTLFLCGLFAVQCLAQSIIPLEHVDKFVSKIPKKEKTNLEKLTNYIIRPFNSDIEKIRAIYSWIGNNIKYDRKGIENDELNYNHQAEEVFKKGRGVCTGFANLFTKMTEMAGINSVPVSGYSKNTLTSSVNPTTPDHVWNAVKIEGKWYLLDVTWDAGLWMVQDLNDQKRKDSYFLSDPLVFLQDHLPAIPIWQLLDTTFGMNSFIKNEISEHDTSNIVSDVDADGAIEKFLSMDPALQRVYEYRESYKFNPTFENGEAMAHGLLDYTSILEDSLDTMIEKGVSDSLRSKMLEQMVSLCIESDPLTEFHDWQARMCANSIHSVVIEKYNTEIQRQYSDSLVYFHLFGLLDFASKLLKPIEEDFLTKGIRSENENLIRVISRKLDIKRSDK